MNKIRILYGKESVNDVASSNRYNEQNTNNDKQKNEGMIDVVIKTNGRNKQNISDTERV